MWIDFTVHIVMAHVVTVRGMERAKKGPGNVPADASPHILEIYAKVPVSIY